MTNLRNIVEGASITRVSDYFSLYRKIENAANSGPLENSKSVRIAIVSSTTINGIKEILSVQCAEFNVMAHLYMGDYNQYIQEILDPSSGLYAFNPDVVIIYADTRTVFGEHFFRPYELSPDQRRAWTLEKTASFVDLAQRVADNTNAKVLLHNLEVPVYSSLGLMENKEDFGFIEAVESINAGLRERFKKTNQIFVFDFNAFCSRIGKDNLLDHKMYYLGDLKLKLQHLPLLCAEYSRYIWALSSFTKKCIVLDLDNTLWGGVIGESGIDGIELGPTPEGRPFLEFQMYLLSLFDRGVILAINSKNNPEDALLAIRSHPHMVLKEDHFAAVRMNWDDKATNMRALAAELNIGLDSMVFFDDDSMNRELVGKLLPDVAVVEMPKDPSLYVKTLTDLHYFDSLSLTTEDRKKGKMYLEEKERRKLVSKASDLAEYLKMLEVTVKIDDVTSSTLPRIAQLTQKTNQFNTTTRRYTEEAITVLSQDGTHRIFSLNVSDKFGDSGLTGVAIVNKSVGHIWRIESFMLSCRVLGRKAEEALLAYIAKEAKKDGAERIVGEFIHSPKNQPAKDFYEKNGFNKIDTANDVEEWIFDLSKKIEFPDHITCLTNNS